MKSEVHRLKEKPYFFDKVGRVIVEEDRALRIITDNESIRLYKEILNSPQVNTLFSIGLIETKINCEDKKENILILEHKKINFILHPSEYTNEMFWEAATAYIKLCKELYNKFGALTIDAHPWNMTFDGSKPVFFDFSSIYRGNNISDSWINEFERYFALPIRLASFSKRTYELSQEYRREHLKGFGLNLLRKNWLKKVFNKRFQNILKENNSPERIFDKILEWLEENKPIHSKAEYWLEYEQAHNTKPESPKTDKQNFVYKILAEKQPQKVLDLASNKGFYSMMAANLGASVLALDYEEKTVDACRKEAHRYSSKVTSGMMDFIYPTPPSGPALMTKSSYYRFKCDIVLALALIHHVCLTQQLPVSLFCEICKNYALDGILLEFVDPADIHLKNWKSKVPDDYTIDSIKKYMADKFPKSQMSENFRNDGINRTFIYFYN